MVDAEKLKPVVEAMASGCPGESRRQAEVQLERWIQELLDAKVRHSLTATTGLSDLTAAVLTGSRAFSAAGAVVLDRFRYRLAHVAMRNQHWDLASDLLDAVLEGTGELTRARLYRTVCKHRGEGRIDDDDLRKLVQRYRKEGMERPGAPPLDVLVQEPTTCLLELLLLCQGGEPQLLDQLYEQQGRQRTTALTLFIKPNSGRHSSTELSEWLAQAHLEEWSNEGWLVVDITVERDGDLGRGSDLHCTNFSAKLLVAIAQVLARAAVVPGLNQGLTPDTVRDRFKPFGGRDLIESLRTKPRWQYVTSGGLASKPSHKIIKKDRLNQTWRLIPPYVVVWKDSATALRQEVGSSQ